MNTAIESFVSNRIFDSVVHLYSSREDADKASFSNRASAILMDIRELKSHHGYTHCLISNEFAFSGTIYMKNQLDDVIDEMESGREDWHYPSNEDIPFSSIKFRFLTLPRLTIGENFITPSYAIAKTVIGNKIKDSAISASLYKISGNNVQNVSFAERKIAGWYKPMGKKVTATCSTPIPEGNQLSVVYCPHKNAASVSLELFPVNNISERTYVNNDTFINSLLGIELSVYSPNGKLIYPGWKLVEDIKDKLR